MSNKLLILGAALAAALAATDLSAADLSAYGRLPTFEHVTISPDGKHLAIIVTNGEARTVEIFDVDAGKVIGGINAGDKKVRDLRFAGDHHVIVVGSSTGDIPFVESPRDESYVPFDFDIDTKKLKPLLPGLKGNGLSTEAMTLNTINGLPAVRQLKGRPTAFAEGVAFVDNVGQPAVFRVDLESGTEVLEKQLDESTEGWVVGDADLLGELQTDSPDGKWSLRRWANGHWNAVYHDASPIDEQPTLESVGRDGASFLVRIRRDHEPELREISLDGKTVSDPLPLPGADDFWTEKGGPKLIGLSELDRDELTYRFFDPHDQAVWNAVVKAYPGERVTLVDYDAARDRWVVLVDSPTDGPAYALVDLNKKSSDWIGPEYADLGPADFSAVRALSFKAKDGLDLSGYLTTPRGKPEKSLPLVVLVHGGPQARDEPGFDWWSQALASRGYAVLQVNYRGSGGFDWQFLSKGFGEWGRKMQTDLDDGVHYLVDQGIVDPKRVCIVGASYGGYAALAGAAFGHGLYRCAASVAGPSDLAKMISWDQSRETDRAAKATKHYWLRYMGPAEELDEISPARHAADVTAPILLVHGKDDTVVDYGQSQIMADALRKAGKPFDFVTLKNEDHWLSRGATRLEMLTAVCDFLAKNNPPS